MTMPTPGPRQRSSHHGARRPQRDDSPPPLYLDDIYDLVRGLKGQYSRRDQAVFDEAILAARRDDRGHERDYGPLARWPSQIEYRVELVRQAVGDHIRRIHAEARQRAA